MHVLFPHRLGPGRQFSKLVVLVPFCFDLEITWRIHLLRKRLFFIFEEPIFLRGARLPLPTQSSYLKMWFEDMLVFVRVLRDTL